MKLFDVNVLLYAYHPESPRHAEALHWLESRINRPAAFGLAEMVLSGFLRIVTHPRVFKHPIPTEKAVRELDRLRQRPNCVIVRPGPRPYEIFTDLCLRAGAKGNLIADAYLAALAIEHGCQWVSYDRSFARFPGLDWIDPGAAPHPSNKP
jgi:toxin-antitoxin system PIN domain toxin